MDGALVKRFNAELQKVWENVFDMRTDAHKTRTIALIFKFTPNAQRDAAEMRADVQVKGSDENIRFQTLQAVKIPVNRNK